MTTKEQIIYSKLLEYGKQEYVDDDVYIDNELKLSIARAKREMVTLNKFKENPFYRPLKDDFSFLGRGKIFIKRVLRKLNVFYIKPICEQQSMFNCSVAKSSQELMIGEKVINDKLVILTDEILSMKEELRKCKEELAELKEIKGVSGDKKEK